MDTFKDILPTIMKTGDNVLFNDNMARDYVPWLVNRALAHYPDSLMLANEMNLCPTLDKKLQYEYLLNTVRKYSRKHRWYKRKPVDPDVETAMEYYGYSEKKAKQVVQLLTREQLDIIRRRLDKGGIKNEEYRSPT